MNELEILVPITGILVGGVLIALRILKPFGNRVLELLEQTHRDRRAGLQEDAELEQIHRRLDVLSERQDFLESLLSGRERAGLPREGAAGGEEDPGRDRMSAVSGDGA